VAPTLEQKQLAVELARLAPRLGDLYEAAVFFVSNSGFPGRRLFLAHAVREIGNSLPDALEQTPDRRQFQWQDRLRSLLAKWEELGLGGHWASAQQAPGTEPPNVSLPWRLYTEIRDTLIEFQASDERTRDKVFRLFRNLAPELYASHDHRAPVADEWMRTIRWFVDLVHERRSGNEGNAGCEDMDGQFARFESLLRFLLPTLGVVQALDEVDDILSEANRTAG